MREEVLYMIFLDLHKVYDALDRSRCLEILEGYGIRPRARKLLTNYWHRLTMVARAGGYYGTDFQGDRGVTQEDPLYPTIFNLVVDLVVRHCVTGFLKESEAIGELVQEGRHQVALFCANDGMFALLDPVWLQGSFNALVGLFGRVVLQTNVGKTVGMVCHPCQAAGNLTTAAYGRSTTGRRQLYR